MWRNIYENLKILNIRHSCDTLYKVLKRSASNNEVIIYYDKYILGNKNINKRIFFKIIEDVSDNPSYLGINELVYFFKISSSKIDDQNMTPILLLPFKKKK